MRRPAGMGPWGYVSTDFRKKVYANLNLNYFWGFENTIKGGDYSLGITYQPINSLNINLSGSYSTYWRRQDQFVTSINYNNMTRTIVSEVDQKTLRFVARVNYNITPDLTLQYYGQPYITRPLYTSFGYITNPLAKNYDDRFHVFTPNEIS